MGKGILYVMTTIVDGLIKIGRTGSDNFQRRMLFLEGNGYRNVGGLKRAFAIEVSDYEEKEKLLHSLFAKSRVANTELFTLNINEVKQLLTSFDGKIVYPAQDSRKEIFEAATEAVQSLLLPDGTYNLNVKERISGKYVRASMQVIDGKLYVKEGAELGQYKKITVESWRQARQGLKVSEDGNLLLEGFEATTPSMAASVILGQHSNGWKVWKDSNGHSIDKYRREKDADPDQG